MDADDYEVTLPGKSEITWHRSPLTGHYGAMIRPAGMVDVYSASDPLAPPEGYGQRSPAGEALGPWAERDPDLTACNMAPCPQPVAVVFTMACSNEHVFEAGYCAVHAGYIQNNRLMCVARRYGSRLDLPYRECKADLVIGDTRQIT